MSRHIKCDGPGCEELSPPLNDEGGGPVGWYSVTVGLYAPPSPEADEEDDSHPFAILGMGRRRGEPGPSEVGMFHSWDCATRWLALQRANLEAAVAVAEAGA